MTYPLKSQLFLHYNRQGIHGVSTRGRITSGSAILKFTGSIIDCPNRYSIQIGRNLHLGKSGDFDDFINHSCRPNSFIRFPELTLEALYDIGPGEELTINYCASELEMQEPFECGCGMANCYKIVKGFAYLSDPEKKALKGILSPFLETLLFQYSE